MKKTIFKRRIDWLMESMGEGKTEEELRQNVTDQIMEDSHTIKNKLIIRPYQFDELIDEDGNEPEYGTPAWHENYNISKEYWEDYTKKQGVRSLTNYLITGKRE